MVNITNIIKYCKEYWLIENYDKAMADTTQIWVCHHRKETDWGLSMSDLMEIGWYYNVHYSELIFLTKEEHQRLHGKSYCKSKEHLDISKEELQELYINKGFSQQQLAKTYHCSINTISDCLKIFGIKKIHPHSVKHKQHKQKLLMLLEDGFTGTREQMAEHIGKNLDTVTRWKQRGKIVEV